MSVGSSFPVAKPRSNIGELELMLKSLLAGSVKPKVARGRAAIGAEVSLA